MEPSGLEVPSHLIEREDKHTYTYQVGTYDIILHFQLPTSKFSDTSALSKRRQSPSYLRPIKRVSATRVSRDRERRLSVF